MTPKEKAKQLIEKITVTLQDADMYGWYDLACKNCALIAVNEIIEQLSDDWGDNQWRANDYIGYWKQVKQEIESL